MTFDETPILNASEDAALTPAFTRLLERRDFLKVAASRRRWVTKGYIIQYRPPQENAAARPARVGFTVSKKVGNAVMRNRVRRRLKEVVRLNMAPLARAGADYVLIGRTGSENIAYDQLERDLAWGLKKLHADVDLNSTRDAKPPKRLSRGDQRRIKQKDKSGA